MESYGLAALLGLGLAASSGLNTFLPLLMLAGAAHFKLMGIDLNGSFAWLASDTALAALGVATLVEIVGDKVPVVDHALDVLGTFARPAAGTLAAASVFHGADPTTAAIAGLVIGAPVAFGVHTAKSGTRAASSATTLGIGNPILSTIEDLTAGGLTLAALANPWLVPLVLLAIGFVAWRVVKAAKALKGRLNFGRNAAT